MQEQAAGIGRVEIINDLMNFGSFWTIWFWICHVVAWSMASHFTLGVPYDMILEANREDREEGPWSEATEALILAQVFRFSEYARRFGTTLAGVSAFLLSVCVTLGTMGDLEIARALLTILFPLTLVYVFGVRAALKIEAAGLRGPDLRGKIKSQRLINQAIGLLAVTMAVALAIWEIVRDMAFPMGF